MLDLHLFRIHSRYPRLSASVQSAGSSNTTFSFAATEAAAARMLSAKTLFLGVYTANGILSRLFVPVCYVFSLSPFGLLFLRYSGLGQKLLDSVPQHYRTPDIWPQIFLALVALLLATRVASGRDGSGVNGTRRVQLLPYWIPGVKHWWNLVFGGEKWLKSIR